MNTKIWIQTPGVSLVGVSLLVGCGNSNAQGKRGNHAEGNGEGAGSNIPYFRNHHASYIR